MHIKHNKLRALCLHLAYHLFSFGVKCVNFIIRKAVYKVVSLLGNYSSVQVFPARGLPRGLVGIIGKPYFYVVYLLYGVSGVGFNLPCAYKFNSSLL